MFEEYYGIGPPVIEELARTITLLVGNISLLIFYTVLSSIFEFVIYIQKEGESITPAFVFIRLCCIGVHCSLAFIHSIYYKQYLKWNNKKYLIKGLLIATSCHIIWNNGLGLLIYSILKI